MNTKLLMSLSAIFMAVLGIAASFAPQEIVRHYGFSHAGLSVLPIQVAGALYLGFAILNWMARANLMGGIYSRPVALGNLLHFAVVTIALLKVMTGGLSRSGEIIVGSIVYLTFSVWFGLVVFTHPRQRSSSTND
jgi:hypothetical protein